MHHSTLERGLTKAEKWVAQSHDRVIHQRAVVLQNLDKGLDSAIARAILQQLETSHRTYIANRDQLLEEIGLRSVKPPGCSPCGNTDAADLEGNSHRARV